MTIINENIKEKWVIYSAFDFMDRFGIKKELEAKGIDWNDYLEKFDSDDDLIMHHLEKDNRKFKVRFGWSVEYHDDCWFIEEAGK